MRGFPKVLSTKEDYLFCKDNFPKENWAPEFQALLDTMYDWMFVRYLDEDEVEPVADDPESKVVPPQENSVETRKALYRMELNPNCKLLTLGFTKEEVESYLSE